MLLPAKQASEPSPKLIIVATCTHGNNGGAEIAMLHLVADPGPLDGPAGCVGLSERNGPIWRLVWGEGWSGVNPPMTAPLASTTLCYCPVGLNGRGDSQNFPHELGLSFTVQAA